MNLKKMKKFAILIVKGAKTSFMNRHSIKFLTPYRGSSCPPLTRKLSILLAYKSDHVT